MRSRFLVAGRVLLSAICLASVGPAQTGWWRTYGGTNDDWGSSARQTLDSAYVIAGTTESFGAGFEDVYLIKTNNSGDTLWTRAYGGASDERGNSIRQTSDGGYIVAGLTYSFGEGVPGYSNVYLIKTDASGDTVWTRTYGGTYDDRGYDVQQTADSGYIVAGLTYSFGPRVPGYCNVYLIKTGPSGDTLWTRTYGGLDHDLGFSVLQTVDSGYIIAGETYSFGAGGEDVYLIKTDASGYLEWSRTYGGTAGYSIQQTSDGGYVIAGSTPPSGGGMFSDIYLIKTDAEGETLWTRTYGGTHLEDEGYSVQQTSDGGYIIAGCTGDPYMGNDDVYLIRTSASGDTLWTKTYGGTSGDIGNSVRQTSDGGYVIAGRAWSFGAGESDVYLIKTDSLGDVGVAEESRRPRPGSFKQPATVLYGPSGVRCLASSVVYDAMGRRVQHPMPGIYFLKTTTDVVPRKVLLIR